MRQKPQQIMEVIKRACQGQGLTQSKVAQLLQVSLPTVKRWFAGSGVSMEILTQLMELTGLSFQDIHATLPSLETDYFYYTEEQEEFFVLHPHHLAFFDQLLNGLSARQIVKKYRLNNKSLRTYLRDLEKIELIEVHPGDRVKILPSGSPRWSSGGPLDQNFGRQAAHSFVDAQWSGPLTLFLHRYSKSDRELIEQSVTALKTLAARANRRAKLAGTYDRSFGLLLGLAPFQFELLRDVRNL